MGVTIRALIFDLDGVITRASAEYHFRSWERLAQEEGIAFTRQDNEQLLGVPRAESLRRFLKGRTLEAAQMQAWMARKDAYFHEFLDEMTPQDGTPGIRAFLTEAQENGIHMGVASASRNVRVVLEKLALLSCFEVVGDATLGVRPKPLPDLFLWVAGYLQAQPGVTVVFEDSESGLQAARESGFWTVGIGDAELPWAHFTVSDMTTLRVTDLAARFEAQPVDTF